MWKFLQDHWGDGIEILLLATCIYQIYRSFRATRGAQILVGLGAILVVLTLVSTIFKFEVISFIIKGAATILTIALIVIFQPELRNGLARLVVTHYFRSPAPKNSPSSNDLQTQLSASLKNELVHCSRSNVASA